MSNPFDHSILVRPENPDRIIYIERDAHTRRQACWEDSRPVAGPVNQDF